MDVSKDVEGNMMGCKDDFDGKGISEVESP